MKKEIKYIGFYSDPNSKVKRTSALPATNKMDYICETLINIGFDVHLVSPAWIVDSETNAKYESKKTTLLGTNKRLTLFPSIGTKKKIFRNIKILLTLFYLSFWLIVNIKKREKIIFYHSPWLVLPVLIAKRIKGFKVILEVEEVYSDVSSLHPFFDKMEIANFKNADSFILSTDLLNEKINIGNRKFLVLYGQYTTYPKPHQNKNNKIKLLYAGIIDSDKLGAFNAIESAIYLSKEYEMHIIGFGEVGKLKNRITKINKTSNCKVFYDGLKSGDDYINYCQSFDIGLSTQKMDGAYLQSSFPSKILSYLGMGLNVVSCNVECVSLSKINHLVNFYYKDTPKHIAEAIHNTKLKNREYIISEISQINNKFTKEIKELLCQD